MWHSMGALLQGLCAVACSAYVPALWEPTCRAHIQEFKCDMLMSPTSLIKLLDT